MKVTKTIKKQHIKLYYLFLVGLRNAYILIYQGREYFMKYLKKEGAESLLGLWNAVEALKVTEHEGRHQAASELYQQYVAAPSSLLKVTAASRLARVCL